MILGELNFIENQNWVTTDRVNEASVNPWIIRVHWDYPQQWNIEPVSMVFGFYMISDQFNQFVDNFTKTFV